MDGQATVPSGEVSRGGLTRGDSKACEHAWGLQEQDLPGGIVEEENGPWRLTVGRSSQTRACSVEALEAWGSALEETEQGPLTRLQITRDNGPERRGRRTQFFPRMVEVGDAMGKPLQLLYSPLPSQVSSHRALRRPLGIARKQDQGGGCGDEGGVGQE